MEDKLIDILKKKYGEREASDKLNSLDMTDNEGNVGYRKSASNT